jgi:hypothetical protein
MPGYDNRSRGREPEVFGGIVTFTQGVTIPLWLASGNITKDSWPTSEKNYALSEVSKW